MRKPERLFQPQHLLSIVISIVTVLLLSGLIHIPQIAYGAKPEKQPIRILSYSSFYGEGSLGEWLEKHPESPCRKWRCEFSTPHPNRSLFEELRAQASSPKKALDLVIGLDTLQLQWATEAGFVRKDPILLGESAIVLLAHKSGPPATKESFRDWRAAQKAFQGKVVFADPRYSAITQTFLAKMVQSKSLDIAAIKSLSNRVFPKWSSAYEYFAKKSDLLFLTFASSQSYSDCHPSSDSTRIVSILAPHASYKEWIAVTKNSNADLSDFLLFFKRDDFASAVANKNWLVPRTGIKSTEACFQQSPHPDSVDPAPVSRKAFQSWMDEWSL